MTTLDCAGRPLDLRSPRVMGVLNVTPDSFSDGGRFDHVDTAVGHALRMQEAGADLIDIGGESTRPGAPAVEVDEEMNRVLPVIESLAPQLDIPLSIDTSKAEVMRAAVNAGAGMINDVRALSAPGALAAAQDTGVPVCLMHMRGVPGTMQQAPVYDDVVTEVRDFLTQRVAQCEVAGIPRTRLLLDPGFGFGKTLAHNLALLRALPELTGLGLPILVGISRKSMLGQITGREVEERLAASIAAAVLAVERGAAIVRVHDVSETVDALKLIRALAEN